MALVLAASDVISALSRDRIMVSGSAITLNGYKVEAELLVAIEAADY